MPKSFQITIPAGERSKLIDRIEQDMLLAKASHTRYAERCRRWMQKWEARVEKPKPGDEGKPNHVVPLIQWQSFNKLARDIQALLGEDAEITAKGTGPSDAKLVHKISCYMTSRVFDQMALINPLCVFEFRRILFGWACAYRPWWRREYDSLDEQGQRTRVCDFEGPGFFPEEPDNIVVPNERGVTSIQDFSFVGRRVRVTVDDLIRGDGTLYQGTSDPAMIKKLIDWAEQGPTNDYLMAGQDPVREERERSEGVDYDAYMTGRRSLWLWEWYGKWRPLKGKTDAQVNDLSKRETFEADWVVKYIPGMKEIVGVQDLLQLYPKMRKRRPFVESTLIKDGTYRPKGFGALLEDLEDDATANSRLFQAAGELSVWPIVFYKPGAGLSPKTLRLEPGNAYPCENPGDVNVINLRPNLDFAVARQQDILATAERITGITDQSLGRAVERPNAPRTATGQLALIEEGNIRAYLDSTILREDMEQIIGDFWDLDCDLVPKTEPGLFFRVTEEKAGGLFDIRQGGAFMTPKEFGGRYDFKLKFATSVWSRQAKKNELMGFFAICLKNPIVASNPKALWALTNRLAREFGIDDFASLVPPPPDLDQPKTPDQEWNDMLQGEVVKPNPQDHDELHLIEHHAQLEEERTKPDRDVQAIKLMVKHILDTEQQIRTKQLMASLTSQVMESIMPRDSGGVGGQMAQTLAQMYGGGSAGAPGGEVPGGDPGDIQAPPNGVGSQAAPVAQDGML